MNRNIKCKISNKNGMKYHELLCVKSKVGEVGDIIDENSYNPMELSWKVKYRIGYVSVEDINKLESLGYIVEILE